MAASKTPSMGSAARAAAASRSEHEDRIQSLYADVCKVGMLTHKMSGPQSQHVLSGSLTQGLRPEPPCRHLQVGGTLMRSASTCQDNRARSALG